MADAIPAMTQDPKGPQGVRLSKAVALPPAVAEAMQANAGLVADPNTPPSVEGSNPIVQKQNVGSPDHPVREFSAGIERILGEVNAAAVAAPKAVYELPGGAIRTDW